MGRTIFVIAFLFVSGIQSKDKIQWQALDRGLFLAEIISPQESTVGDNKITVLKIDPAYYDFKLFSQAENPGEDWRTAEGWAKDKKLIAVINAGMYQADHSTNVGYMKNYDFINNGKLNKNNTILAFNRKDTTVPEIQIIDLECQDWEVLKDKYHSFSQSIRMIDCHQKNRWSQQNKMWSMAAIGIDKEGNTLFIFTRSPYTVHDFNKILLELPLNIYNAMYLEGGPEASFYLNHKGIEVKRFGSYETGFREDDNNDRFWVLPNIIGVVKK